MVVWQGIRVWVIGGKTGSVNQISHAGRQHHHYIPRSDGQQKLFHFFPADSEISGGDNTLLLLLGVSARNILQSLPLAPFGGASDLMPDQSHLTPNYS